MPDFFQTMTNFQNIDKINKYQLEKLAQLLIDKGLSKYELFMNYVGKVFDFALHSELIKENPMTKTYIPKPKRKKKKETPFFDKNELHEFIECAYKYGYGAKWGSLFHFMAYTGCRVGEACALRFRPIMMTSLSTMIAMIPLIIGNIGPGAGEGSRLAVGATILGGMIISTFFTLYVTPTMYLALAKNTKRIDAVDIELKKQLR